MADKQWFDEARGEIASQQNSDMQDAQEALLNAGVDPNIVKNALTPGIAALIARAPSLAQVWAQRYPANSYSTYTSAEAQFFGGLQSAQGLSGAEGPSNLTTQQGSVVAHRDEETGVIVTEDQSTGDVNVLYPNDPDGTIPGSPMWRRKARQAWNAADIKRWRKKLYKTGYISQAEGGFNTELYQALGEFFTNKYADLPHPGSPQDAKTSVKDAYDPVLMRQDVRDTLRGLYGDEPSDGEVDHWVPVLKKWTKRAVNHGASPEHAQARAQEKFATDFTNDPGVSKYLDLQEMDTSLHDSFTNLFQSIHDIAS